MVYGAILDRGEQGHTYLAKIFQSIEPVQRRYHWLITDCECFPGDPKVSELLSQEYCLISGEALSAMVKEEDFQWVWAVFSAFEQDVTLDEILRYPLPYANGNQELWKNPVSIQHPLAQIEIVAFDSTLTLFRSRDQALTARYQDAFSKSQD